MRRRKHHRYDLPRSAYDYQLQMCGRIAVVLMASCAIACLVGLVMLVAKIFATALVVVQP